VLARAKGGIDRRSAIECICALVNSVAAGLNLEIGLGFVLRFLWFLGASKVLVNSINRLVNTKLHTLDFG
jgi:hypothetical protein